MGRGIDHPATGVPYPGPVTLAPGETSVLSAPEPVTPPGHRARRTLDADDPQPRRSGSPRHAPTAGSAPATRRRALSDPTPWIIGITTFVLRMLTAATGPTDWDSSQYAAGVQHFDVTHGRPQPPGYWLYVEAGRLVSAVGGRGTITSLVLVAAVASAVGAGLAVVAGRDLGGWWMGTATGVLVATSPFVWFTGSMVATYSFDLLACCLLIILAWRARPGSWHGVAAFAALGLLAGFRQSMVEAFALLVLVPVVVSTRTWQRALATVAAGAAGVAVWFVPMVAQQPGGFGAWLHATRAESVGAARTTSILDHAPQAANNLGVFAAFTTLALAPLVLLAALAGVALGLRRLTRGPAGGGGGGDGGGGNGGGDNLTAVATPPWVRPWYQSAPCILVIAVVPPAAIVALVQFAKGGYLLAYLPAAIMLCLLPVAALVRGRPRGSHGRHSTRRSRPARRFSPVWAVVATVLVGAIAVAGATEFVSSTGVLPMRYVRADGGLWLQQPRYQAPYPTVAATIRTADQVDAALVALGPSVDDGRDVVVMDTFDGGGYWYRNAGWAMPGARVALLAPGQYQYNELGGTLYYAPGRSVAVAPGGSVILIASGALPGLATLADEGYALPLDPPLPIAGYGVWRILPGVTLLGTPVVTTAGPRPLGSGI